ncbi:ATP-dependent nuclease [Peribacillus huizhouensis]|uniref:ABC-type lipoprotein export system ATPase subunit n=1 Tax=Peribacillus huizhouensis TaxID=1501239 RepID=A0ABR6CUP0_9BACI|nr:AAA family ATPase [Peribacillus huizhouensis]MBA9028743.1 ABC-type lipoprotein export system ATPase subunit [Peribacillus huizhouensis]
MKLTRIIVKNFKKIDEATVNFEKNLIVLVGPNNSGKSSLIQGILLGYQSLLKLYNSDRIVFNENGYIDKEQTAKRKGIRIEEFQFLLDDLKTLFNVKVLKPFEKNEIVSLYFGKKFITISASLIGEYFSVKVTDCSENITKNDVVSFINKSITLIPSFFTVVSDEERKSQARYNSLLKSGNYNQLFRNILFDLKSSKPKSFKKLSEMVEDIFGIKGLNVEFDEKKDEFINATYTIEGIEGRNTKKLGVATLGMGTLQFIQVLAQVLLGQPSIILLDEPDAHLHSGLQIKIIQLLNDLSNTHKINFVIATHSKDIINNVKPTQVVSFNNFGKLEEVKETNQFINVLKTLGATTEELIGINVGKRLVIVEGEDDVKSLNELCIKFGIDKLENFSLIKFIPLGGRDNVLKNQLFKFFTNINNMNDFKKIAIFDRDYRFIEQQSNDAEKLRSKGFDVLAWSKKELENYFIEPVLVSNVINKEFRQEQIIEPGDVQAIIDKTFEEQKEDIIVNEYAKAFELEEKAKASKNNGISIKELGEETKRECRKRARNYIESQDINDIVSGKEVLKEIRINLIKSGTPSQSEFITKLIENLINDEVNVDILNFVEVIKTISR